MNVNVGHKLRFQVFRRDGFACVYCGAKAPYVHISPDHIVPKSQGGLDVLDNLVTCCEDCNKGKGTSRAGHLGIERDHHEIELLQSRINALLELNVKARELADYLEGQVDVVDRFWWEKLANDPGYTFGPPTRAMLRYFLRRLDIVAVEEAMSLAWETYHDSKRIRPVYRLLWRSIERRASEED